MSDSSPEVVNVGLLVSRSTRLYRDRVAVRSADRSMTYGELEARSNRLVNALLGLGLRRGDRVGVYLPNCPEIVELELACFKAAFVKAPMNSRLSPVEAGAMVDNSESSVVLTSSQRAEACRPHIKGEAPRFIFIDKAADGMPSYESLLAAASDRFEPVRVRRDDLAVLHYTSGSSGVLKAAMQTFGNRLAQMRKFLVQGDAQRCGDIIGLVGPITHASGMQIMPTLASGATIRVFSSFEPQRYMAEMKAERVTHTFLVPTMINMLLSELQGRYKPMPDLKRLSYGAAPMAPARVLQAMDVFGPVLSQGYGAGETTSGVCGLTIDDHLRARAVMPDRLASCGRPYVECMVDVVDAEGAIVDAGEMGEIVVSGPDVFAGYWRAPELTAEVLKDGRYHTGDIARVDDEGYIYIVDRVKDMVISGGF
ncbi:MAG: AMP-dependent synthetase, partial [Hyphomicrobiales bacterium]